MSFAFKTKSNEQVRKLTNDHLRYNTTKQNVFSKAEKQNFYYVCMKWQLSAHAIVLLAQKKYVKPKCKHKCKQHKSMVQDFLFGCVKLTAFLINKFANGKNLTYTNIFIVFTTNK